VSVQPRGVDPSDLDDLAGLPSWFARAACKGMTWPDVMFDGPESDALAVCARCEVVAPCGAYALAHGLMWGVWGGMTEAARKLAARDDRAA
jgi:WhiB family transcriptional regulator, redox-sensing transcriptional regulator